MITSCNAHTLPWLCICGPKPTGLFRGVCVSQVKLDLSSLFAAAKYFSKQMQLDQRNIVVKYDSPVKGSIRAAPYTAGTGSGMMLELLKVPLMAPSGYGMVCICIHTAYCTMYNL